MAAKTMILAFAVIPWANLISFTMAVEETEGPNDNSNNKLTRSVLGNYQAQLIEPEKATKITDYGAVEEIPTERLTSNWNQVYQLGDKHYLVHKAKLFGLKASKVKGTSNDVWIEVKLEDSEKFYGPPVADTILYAETGGSATFTKSLELGMSLVRYSTFQRSIVAIEFSSPRSFTFGPSITVKAEASCKIPPGKTGALYLFEISEQAQGQIREWTWKQKRYRSGKYRPKAWEYKNEVIRGFRDVVFVCTLDQEYIEAIRKKSYENSPPLTNYSELAKGVF